MVVCDSRVVVGCDDLAAAAAPKNKDQRGDNRHVNK